MRSNKTLQSKEASIASAVKTLSTIADMEMSSVLGNPLVREPQSIVVASTMRWLHQKNAQRMFSILKEKLHITFQYLKHFYRSEKNRFASTEAIEGIKNIVRLADEASRNLDRYTDLFLGNQAVKITETDEFKNLCSFYKTKIIPIETHRKVATWIGGLPVEEILLKSRQPSVKIPSVVKPLSLGIEALKEDRDYELLFMRQADGHTFFSPRLIRNMRLACDIERAVDQRSSLVEKEVHELKRSYLSAEAISLIERAYPALDSFFHMAHLVHEKQLVRGMFGPAIALLMYGLKALSGDESQMAKGIEEYGYDFKLLFAHLLESSEFKRLLAYPPQKEDSWEHVLMNLVETLSSQIFIGSTLTSETVNKFNDLIDKRIQRDQQHPLSKDLFLSYKVLRKLLGSRHSSTLSTMLHNLEVTPPDAFEPLFSEDFTTHLFDISCNGKLIPVIAMPSPTRQEYISKAVISEVFQVALQRMCRQNKSILLINLQDRTSTKEVARCDAIEGLSAKPEMASTLTEITLQRDGDFYNQLGQYEQQSSAPVFMKQLIEHMTGPGMHWKATEAIRKEMAELVRNIHRLFFHRQPTLTRTERLDFIELIHTMAICHAIDESHPDVIFMSCKNGVDVTLPTLGSLYGFFTTIHQHKPSSEEMGWIKTMLLGLPLIKRGRLLFPERVERLASLLRFLEKTQKSCIDDLREFDFLKMGLLTHSPSY